MLVIFRFLFRELRKERKRKLLFSFSASLNFLGAILEGSAYFLMILAFSCLTSGPEGLQVTGILGSFLNISFVSSQSPQFLFFFFILFGLGAQLAKNSLCFLAALCNAELAYCCQADLQKNVVSRFLDFSFAHVNQYKSGQLAELARAPTVFLRPFLEGFNHLVISISLIVVAVTLMVMLSPLLSLLTGVLFCLAFLFQRMFISNVAKTSQGLMDQNTLFSIKISETLNSLRIVHIFGRESKILNDDKDILETTTIYSKRIVKCNALVTAISEISGIIAIGLMLIVGYFVLGKKEEIPLLLGFIAVVYRLSGKIQLGASSLAMMLSFKGQINNLMALFNDKEKEFKAIGGIKDFSFKREISIKNVSFTYPGRSQKVINNLSLTIPKGKTIALVGKSGGGKSTILDLLLGLYFPNEGAILIDGKNVKELDMAKWREKIGVVTQEPFILSESIESNIRFGKMDATFDEVVEAAKMAHIHHFVINLKEGYKTEVGERGYRLSGGEKQRVALARALVRDPEILIFDEPTSHLDSLSEELIQHTFEHLRGKKTLIIVAHRLSTISMADSIFVMDKGVLVESGSHASLIKKSGLYAQFWQKQATHQETLEQEELLTTLI